MDGQGGGGMCHCTAVLHRDLLSAENCQRFYLDTFGSPTEGKAEKSKQQQIPQNSFLSFPISRLPWIISPSPATFFFLF